MKAILAQNSSQEDKAWGMEKLPAGEFQLDLSQSSTVAATILDSPELLEISSESEVEITAVKMAPKLLTQDEELRKMADEERYGFLHRLEHQQKHWRDHMSKVRDDIASEGPASRKVRRKSFQKAVNGDFC